MQTWVKIAAAIAVLALAGFVYYLRSDGVNDRNARTDFNAVVQCRSCGQEASRKLDVAEFPPFECRKCGKNEVWRLFKCNSCGNRFVPDPVGNPPRPPMIPTCPKCKSQNTGGAVPGGSE